MQQTDKIEHLKMIEDIIKRMASNSFQLKSWAISLVSAILIFADYRNEICFIWITLLPFLAFWILDAIYLQIERKYRKLYEQVRQDIENNTNKISLFDMNISHIQVECVFCTMFSKSVLPIYAVILFTTIVVLNMNYM